ncbi:MAG: hypothetical protein COB67_11745, partial [SAR324 cluster bacterium]
KEKQPVHIGDVELFNPRNYQLRMQSLLRKVEKNFSLKAGHNSHELPKVGSFFGREEKANTFDLKAYLQSFDQHFAVKHSQRTQAQVAQRTALVAAKCENEFNKSVAGMQKFLEKVDKMAIGLAQTSTSPESTPNIDQDIETLRRAFVSFNRKVEHLLQPTVGEVAYIEGTMPTLQGLVKASGSKSIRNSILHSQKNILKVLDISEGLLSQQLLQTKIYLCEASPGFRIAPKQMAQHHWIPVSEGISLMQGEKKLGPLTPGRIYGGKDWHVPNPANVRDETQGFYLKARERQPDDPLELSFLLIMLPQQACPWIHDQNPNFQLMQQLYLPLMQWTLAKTLGHLFSLSQERDAYLKQWQKSNRVLQREKQVKAFESSNMGMSSAQRKEISRLLLDMVELRVAPEEMSASRLLSRRIYNHILAQMKETWPQLPVEERSNKSYTKWRYILSEIIQIMDRSTERSATPRDSPTPVFDILATTLETLLSEFSLENGQQYLNLFEEKPSIDLRGIFERQVGPVQKQILLFDKILEELERAVLQLMQESRRYWGKLEELGTQRPQMDENELERKVIMELSEKLTRVLSQNFPNLQI